jgi:type III secretion system YopN/LcrE/InvE/MxiC family regulator
MLGTHSLTTSWTHAAELAQQASLLSRGSNTPPADSLTNMAEEMAQFFSEARRQERSLQERALLPYESPALRRVEQIEAMLEVLWHDPQHKKNDARRLAAQLLESARHPGSLQLALKSINGSTEQFLLLSHALAQGEEQGESNPALEVLRDRIDVLWARNGVRIRADVNIAPALADADDRGAKDRKAYHDAVLDGGTVSRTLSMLLERYGDNIEAAVERLRRALGADMGAARPSLPTERLQAILHELFLMGALLPLLKNCRDLGRRARLRRRGHPQSSRSSQDGAGAADADEGASLLGDLAEWVSQWLTLGDVRSLLYQYGMNLEPEHSASTYGDALASGYASDGAKKSAGELSAAGSLNEPERVLVFLHGLKAILRQVPERLFPDGDHKLNADQVLASLLDTMILGDADESPQTPT